ncbi:helix-turn-helix domain-containing protein [Jiella marina]|uniref:helix-turn-helix domain-containing protein n=1 Tax=Jiella sp. LLJ827 TaxID=2917712 RepID=UPI002101609B|nr:helix-turn-helix domain-containing protein [Jiella sp. LLJ827]MCQ0990615.1 helix-turn-helix domain-containing protein [Jiella sp. LLJ827]
MTFYTLGQAAKQADVAKSTIHKALKSGDLSAHDRVGTSYRIDPAELQRWMSTRRVELPENAPVKQSETTANALDAIRLRAELDGLQRLLGEVERQRDDLREDRDQWRDQFAEMQKRLAAEQANVRLIEDRRSEAEKKAAERPTGLFGWFGKRSA